MRDIPVHAKVECVDGVCGESTNIILDPVTQHVTHFVVQEKSLFDPVERLVPIEQVIDTTPERIRLRCTKKEFAQMEAYNQVNYLPDAAGYAFDPMGAPFVSPMEPALVPFQEPRIPPGELAVRWGTPVEASDGLIGEVGELLVDPASGGITHLVLRMGHLWGKRDITVPVSLIDRMEHGTVYLKQDKKAIEALPTVPVKRK